MKWFTVAAVWFGMCLGSGAWAQNPLQLKRVDSLFCTPERIVQIAEGYQFLIFGKTYFGKLELKLESRNGGEEVLVRYGEKSLPPGVVDTRPGGTIRSGGSKIRLKPGRHTYRIPVPKFVPPSYAAKRTVQTPEYVGDITPFRYAEVIGYSEQLTPSDVRQIGYLYPFDDDAASCCTSSVALDRVWELCRHSIKATTYVGLYVDGDRERQPYEGDAYINQLSHYSVNAEYALARATIDHLFTHPTWPTEWSYHMHMILWEDYMYTGRTDYLERYYDALKRILDDAPLNGNGLVVNARGLDIIDWPQTERDGYTVGWVNNVPNAFYNNSLRLMSRIARLLGRSADAARFALQAKRHHAAFDHAFWDSGAGLYRDAADSSHHSQHANLFPVAFRMADGQQAEAVRGFLKRKGMSVSVYAAQYLLEALYNLEEDAHALSLMTAKGDRGWLHMIGQGSTITWEAWNPAVKPNLDWNHAWGAAPGNIVARRLFGIRPLKAGFEKVLFEPHVEGLEYGSYRHPTVRGDVTLGFEVNTERVTFSTAAGVPASLILPENKYDARSLRVNGRKITVHRDNGIFFVELSPGTNRISVNRRPNQ